MTGSKVDHEGVPLDLPRLAQDYTKAQTAAVVRYLATLTLDNLRLRQALFDQYIGLAVEQGKPEEIILDLQTKREQLTFAVDLQAFGGKTWGIEWMLNDTKP